MSDTSLPINHNRCSELRVLWPIHCLKTPGWIIGWLNDKIITVCTIVPLDLDSSDRSNNEINSTSSIRSSGSSSPPSFLHPPIALLKAIDHINTLQAKMYWNANLQILGLYEQGSNVRATNFPYSFGTSHTALRYHTGKGPIDEIDQVRPVLLRVLDTFESSPIDGGASPSSHSENLNMSSSLNNSLSNIPTHKIVLYTQPKQNEMYADIFEWKKSPTTSVQSSNNISNHFMSQSMSTLQPINIDDSTVASSAASAVAAAVSSAVPVVSLTDTFGTANYLASIRQMNTSASAEWMLKSPNSPISYLQIKPQPDKYVSTETLNRAFSAHHSHSQPLLSLIARVQYFLLSLITWMLTLVHRVLSWKIPILESRLAEFGLLGSYLEKRTVIILNFVDQYQRLNTLKYTWSNDASVQRAWARFYNTSLAMLVDSFLGIAAAVVLWYYLYPSGFDSAYLSTHVTTLWGYDFLKRNIEWIASGTPAGLKLNHALTHSMGSIFLYYIERWSVIVHHLAQYTPYLLMLVTISGLLGLSMMLVLIHDIAYFMNMHIYWLYSAITRVYHVQLLLLRSLWLLFRGKKNNVLKQRIDSCNSTLEQLILGTLLFTSLIFLIPTTVMYYMFFVFVMFFVLALQASAQVFINLLNYSPYYSTLLYIFNSGTLNGGLYFQRLDPATRLASSTSRTSLVQLEQDSKTPLHVTYFKLNSSKVKYSIILGDLLKTMNLVIANYKIGKLIDSIVFGKPWQNKRFQPLPSY